MGLFLTFLLPGYSDSTQSPLENCLPKEKTNLGPTSTNPMTIRPLWATMAKGQRGVFAESPLPDLEGIGNTKQITHSCCPEISSRQRKINSSQNQLIAQLQDYIITPDGNPSPNPIADLDQLCKAIQEKKTKKYPNTCQKRLRLRSKWSTRGNHRKE